jgi:hypothetical protein
MEAASKIKSVIHRIRWRSVLAVVLLVAFAAVAFNFLPAGYQVGGGVGLKVRATPDSLSPGGASTIEAELKNTDSDRTVKVVVKSRAHDASLIFDETYTQAYESVPISIGPQGTKKITFKLKTKADSLEGRYPVDVTATEEGKAEGAEKRIFLTVKKK